MISRKGIALPLILAFAICLAVLAAALVFSRKESKQQNLANVHFLQANFLAQSAIQMMMLKVSLFPQDVSSAGIFSLGYCPFRGILADEGELIVHGENAAADVYNAPLADFLSDCNVGSFSWKIPGVSSDDYKFRVKNVKVLSAYTDVKEKALCLSVQITSEGEALMKKGGMGTRKEEMVKTILLKRTLASTKQN